jgi:pSer/pThr/pTyr-binding forkhead associated (FHA) protein
MADPATAIPSNAFLVRLADGKAFPLDRPIINIGRMLGNNLVLDDPRVSRNHAQLRAVKDHYVIFDRNSTGGTYINGKRISHSVLYPGDVISLGGVTLSYTQDEPQPRADLAHTVP